MRLFTETTGTGREVVLVHGWGMNGTIWQGFVPHLGPGLRITRIDLPGHGCSPFANHWQDLDGWVEACLEVAPSQALWIGWSLGALIALAAARRKGGRMDGLVAIAGTPRFVRSHHWPHGVAPGTLEQFSASLQNDYQGTLGRFLALQVHGGRGGRDTLRELRQRLAACPEPQPQALDVGLGLLRVTDLRQDLPHIHCPCLWLFGRRDSLVPAAVAGDLARLQPEGVVRVLPGAAHAPFLSHADATAAAIQGFLA